ncbi:MAG: PfkB family carbohydrate kinase [Opitutus sp.]
MNPEPPHIFTLTCNLLAERTLTFGHWSPGKTQRANAEFFQVGGKGINVVKMLHRLGPPATALCFTGGPAGTECEDWLRSSGFRFKTFPTAIPTRAGTVVRGGGFPETTFLGLDVPLDAGAIRSCADFLDQQAEGSILAVCGSVPGWGSPEFDILRDVLHHWPERGPLMVDTYGPPLAWLANEAVTLLRVNRAELQSLYPDDREATTSDLLQATRERFGALCWVVSDGPNPVWFMNDHDAPEAMQAPQVQEISPTGSGDVMLACILHARYHRGMGWRDAVAGSLPYASANAAHPGVAEFPEPE